MKATYKRKWYVALMIIIIITFNSLSYAMAPSNNSEKEALKLMIDSTATPKVNEHDKFISGEHSDIKELIWKYSELNKLDPKYILGICLIETGGTLDPNMVGPKTYSGRAQGVMQLMPVLIKIYEVKNPLDPDESIKTGTEHLKYLINLYKDRKIYDENENLLKTEYIAAIAYNLGQTAIDNMIKNYNCIIIEKLPYETRRYFRIIRAYREDDMTLFKKLMN